MKVEWTVEMLGRQPGQHEEIDEKSEPRLKTWLAAGIVKRLSKPRTPAASEDE